MAGLRNEDSSTRKVALLRLNPSRLLVSVIAFSISGGRFLREIVTSQV